MTKTTDKFGEGAMSTKIIIVIISGLLLCLGASYRAGTALAPPVPILLQTRPPKLAPEPAYLSKASFYIFNFTLEISICILWLAARVDKQFRIPDGASGAFSYAGGFVFAGEAGNEKKRLSVLPGSQQRITSTSSATSVHSRDSRRLSRVSIVSQQSRQEKFEMLERRISWGGVSVDAIRHIFAEDGKSEIPYSAVVENCTVQDIAPDVEGGMVKEMGWDPKSGKWAVRPIVSVGVNTSRPVSLASRPASLTSRPASLVSSLEGGEE